jgi:hypothetical protein
MPADPRIRRSRRTRERRWDQISFLDAAGATTVEPAPRELGDALGLADHAADSASRHDALDRLYASLAQQAIRRGRKPVPKRSDSQGAP